MNVKLDLLWGAEAIAEVIGRPVRTTFNMLEKKEIPARKVNGRWVIERSRLVAFFTEDAA